MDDRNAPDLTRQIAAFQARNLPKIQFDGSDPTGLLQRELRHKILTGTIRDVGTGPQCNIVDTAIDHLRAERVNFQRCDFKDDSIRSSTFADCNFGLGSFAYNTVSETRFERCSFPDTDIHNSVFLKTRFIECDFTNVLIKTCRFFECQFLDCTTSNKVFETSFLADCEFRGTELQVQTIEDNTGISGSRYEGMLRSGRPGTDTRTYSRGDLALLLRDLERQPLKNLNIEYFLEGTMIRGSTFLDASFRLESWMPMFQSGGSFTVVLDKHVEFMTWLYDRGELTSHSIIGLFSLLSDFMRHLRQSAPSSYSLAAIGGLHQSVAMLVEEYLLALEAYERSPSDKIKLLVEGEGRAEYYEVNLGPLFERADARIEKVVPHNSPWELLITFLDHSNHHLFFALLLAIRTRLEIQQLPAITSLETVSLPAAPKKKRTSKKAKASDAMTKRPAKAKGSLAKIEETRIANAWPPSRQDGFNIEFGGGAILHAVLQKGDVRAELHLELSSVIVGKLRSIVKGML